VRLGLSFHDLSKGLGVVRMLPQELCFHLVGFGLGFRKIRICDFPESRSAEPLCSRERTHRPCVLSMRPSGSSGTAHIASPAHAAIVSDPAQKGKPWSSGARRTRSITDELRVAGVAVAVIVRVLLGGAHGW
jgi:hypothetical protein